jgi:hypothetical protein
MMTAPSQTWPVQAFGWTMPELLHPVPEQPAPNNDRLTNAAPTAEAINAQIGKPTPKTMQIVDDMAEIANAKREAATGTCTKWGTKRPPA